MRPAIPLIVLLAMSACQPALLRTVGGLTASGDFVQATEASIRAAKAGDARAPELLEQVAADAYKYEWDRGREAEADGRLEDALAAYDGLIELEKRVTAADGPKLDEQVAVERKTIAEATAYMFAARGEVAYDDGRWQDALDGWRIAEGTTPGFTDAAARIPDALERLGDEARVEHRYREAISLYDQSANAGGSESARAWTAAIHAGIGRHALKNQACRKAVGELTKAAALPFDTTLAADLREARACARRQVVVRPFEDLVQGGIEDKNVGILLVDQLAHHLRTRGSSFIQLIDPGSATAKQKIQVASRRYEVRGHLTRVDVVKTEPSEKPLKARGKLKVPCEPGGEPTCDEEVNVAYTLRSEGLAVTISGNIKVIDVATGEQVGSKPLDIKVDKRRTEMLNPKITDIRGYVLNATIGTRPTERQVGLIGDERKLAKEQPPLPEPSRIVDEAIGRLAAAGATSVLTHIDGEIELPDPAQMELITPIVSASDIQFGDSDIHEHTPEEIEFSDDKPTVEDAPE